MTADLHGQGTVSPLLFSPAAAARKAGIGRDRLYALLHSGELKHIKAGRRYLIPAWALSEWIEKVTGGRVQTPDFGGPMYHLPDEVYDELARILLEVADRLSADE